MGWPADACVVDFDVELVVDFDVELVVDFEVDVLGCALLVEALEAADDAEADAIEDDEAALEEPPQAPRIAKTSSTIADLSRIARLRCLALMERVELMGAIIARLGR